VAGIYIHIPFCKKFCYYCDFYKSANYRFVDAYIGVLIKEISLKKDFTSEQINTIYFGGGTPSSIDLKHISSILKKLNKSFNVSNNAEITFEINPDDVDLEYFKGLKNLGINRLSLGIQSFNNRVLKFLNRRHNAGQATDSIKFAKTAGFVDISIDLIYGIPGQEINDFENDLSVFFDLGLTHLSAYHLTIEEKTHFGRLQQKKLLNEIGEGQSLRFYDSLIVKMKNNGYDHYEISNFSLPTYHSKHNKAYWEQKTYIGFGPSAHSFDKNSRYWNISSVKNYINLLNIDAQYFEKERLNRSDKFNEYIITGLRTKQGCLLEFIQNEFGNNKTGVFA